MAECQPATSPGSSLRQVSLMSRVSLVSQVSSLGLRNGHCYEDEIKSAHCDAIKLVEASAYALSDRGAFQANSPLYCLRYAVHSLHYCWMLPSRHSGQFLDQNDRRLRGVEFLQKNLRLSADHCKQML